MTLTLEDGFALDVSGDFGGGVALPPGSSVNVPASASISVSADLAQYGVMCYSGSLDINMSEDAVLSLTVKNPYSVATTYGVATANGALSINGEGSGNHKSLVSIDAGVGIGGLQAAVKINGAAIETKGMSGVYGMSKSGAVPVTVTNSCLDFNADAFGDEARVFMFSEETEPQSPDVSIDAPIRLYSSADKQLYLGDFTDSLFYSEIREDTWLWYLSADNTIPSRLVSTFDVTFYDEDGTTVLKETQTVDWKDAAVPPADPTKAEDENYTYTFAGWDADFSRVAENLDVKAMYAKTAKGGGSEIKAASAAINQKGQTVTFDANGETRLTLTITPTNANEVLTWASGDDGVVTVTPIAGSALSAILKAIGDGTAIVTVTGADGRILDRVVVTVTGTASGNPTAKISGYTSGGGGGCSAAGFGVLALIAAAPAALRKKK